MALEASEFFVDVASFGEKGDLFEQHFFVDLEVGVCEHGTGALSEALVVVFDDGFSEGFEVGDVVGDDSALVLEVLEESFAFIGAHGPELGEGLFGERFDDGEELGGLPAGDGSGEA